MLNIRSESNAASPAGHRQPGRRDRLDEAGVRRRLLEPICMASIVRLSRDSRAATRTASCSPTRTTSSGRRQGEARGEPRPQEPVDQAELRRRPDLAGEQGARAGYSAYSDLAVGPDGTIYCLYETRHRKGQTRVELHDLYAVQWGMADQ